MSRAEAVCAIVPVRGLDSGKRRLAAVLSEAQRRALCHAMLEDVLDTLAGISRVVVVTDDAAATKIARSHGADVIADRSEGLNASLERARDIVRPESGFSRLLVMPADLPGIAGADIERHILAPPEEVVVARAADGGTNLFCCATDVQVPFSYGVDSARRHVAFAEQAGLSVRLIDLPAFALDIDSPGDLGFFRQRNIASRTADFLAQLEPGLAQAWAA